MPPAPAMTRKQKVERFRAIEQRLDRISVDWQRGSTPTGEGILARMIKEQDPEPILTFDAYADRNDIDFVTEGPADQRFLVDLVRELDDENRQLKPKPKKAPDYAAECGMKCSEWPFQQWLFEVHGLENAHDNIRAATKVRFVLDIKSRADLNTDPEAARRWRKMVEDFETWNKQRNRR